MTTRKQKLWITAGVLGLVAVGTAWASRRSRADAGSSLPRASVSDTLAFALDVFLPLVAKGVIIRRPAVVALAERTGLEARSVRRMQTLRHKYGRGPLMLRLPFREQAVVLAPDDVHRVLRESPEPFSTASSEKRAALSHLEPHGSLVSEGAERADRRRFNEEVLDHGHTVHRLAEPLLAVVAEEAEAILQAVHAGGVLDWEVFSHGWFRMVRRTVFGEGAREDHDLSAMTRSLRSDANWAFLRPRRDALRERFLARIRDHLERAEPGSLAGQAAGVRQSARTAPDHQVAQWLFAFDPAGMATFRALALLAAHPEHGADARQEARSHGGSGLAQLPRLRAAVLEALRLWPTTPMILRQTSQETRWEPGVMPARAGVLIFSPFFHRDDERLSFAHHFTPELWLHERGDGDWPLVPFSGGPAVCPARNLVAMLASAMLANLIRERLPVLAGRGRLDPARLPATLDPYTLRFDYR
ncbi:MAG: cytochrome [Polaromonas sp.]|nr:cytochrome [Polaromonas sp.]